MIFYIEFNGKIEHAAKPYKEILDFGLRILDLRYSICFIKR